jgi:hypothetical protein
VIEALAAQRMELRNKLKRILRAENENGAMAVKLEIAGISDRLKKLRRSLVLADMVESRAEHMRQELDALNSNRKKRRWGIVIFE